MILQKDSIAEEMGIPIKDIITKLEENTLTEEEITKLTNIFRDEMPYGTQKARTGDPYNWLLDKLCNLI